MAEVLVLAENVDADSTHTGTATAVKAGRPITVYATSTGSVGYPSNVRLEGSLDGLSWVSLGGVNFNSFSTFVLDGSASGNHMVNYVRYCHNGASYNPSNDVIVTKVIALQGDNSVKITTC